MNEEHIEVDFLQLNSFNSGCVSSISKYNAVELPFSFLFVDRVSDIGLGIEIIYTLALKVARSYFSKCSYNISFERSSRQRCKFKISVDLVKPF